MVERRLMFKSCGLVCLAFAFAAPARASQPPAAVPDDNTKNWYISFQPNTASLQAEARQALQDSFPGARVRTAGDLVLSVYGRAMDTGDTPEASAERFRTSRASVFGVSAGELRGGLARRDDRQSQQVSYEAATGTYKFTLYYYSQFRDDIPVFRAELRVLVRNDAPHPVVLANSSLRPLGAFDAAGRTGQANPQRAIDAVKAHAPDLDRLANDGLVIWAGVNQQLAEPTLAYTILAENDTPELWLYLVDASTGKILFHEDRIQHVDVSGSVNGSGTPGAKAETCTNDLQLAMPYARLSIGATTVFADEDGQFVIPNAGTDDVTVMSPIRGEWFRVTNFIGSDEELSATVTPPGPVDFSHNGAATEQIRAQVNGYIHANIVRDHVLTYNPSFPTMQVTESPVYVNRTDFLCPGNAWWNPNDLSMNFCLAGFVHPNTSFGAVIYHEYGHHLVNAAGSGQGQYGEGFGDLMSVIISDDPGLGYGFHGSCESPFRTAVNSIQYPCVAGSHECAGLLSGAVWETRNELLVTEPDDYRDIISNLSVNSVLLHTGSNITPQVAIDFLTLDDDDADLDNGTPHWIEICTGFGEHSLNCPALELIEFDYPVELPELVAPGRPTTIRVIVVPNIVDPIETTGTVSYRIGESGDFSTDPMTTIGPNQYEAVLPATECGEFIQFFFTAQADSYGGLNVSDPIDSPTTFHSAIAATSIESIASFDFEITTGWTVSGDATDGQWGAGVPVVPPFPGPPLSDFDGSGSCYLTENEVNFSDVDGGTTILTSPAFDLTDMDIARVSYARWYSNLGVNSPQEEDIFYIRASNDGINYTTMETVGPSGDEILGGWFTRSFLVADTVAHTANVQFRFEVGDLSAESMIEAALDAFAIINVICDPEVVSTDCQPNGVPDYMDIANGTSANCNLNGTPDECDIADGTSLDCNSNGIPDECDLAGGTSEDCNGNQVPDECDDCNANGTPDVDDIAGGTSTDCDGNCVPDECDPDCNDNGITDVCDIADGTSADNNADNVPDECFSALTAPAGTAGATKNRYLSFVPSNGLAVAAIAVDLPDGRQGWVGEPVLRDDRGVDPQMIALVVDAPVFRVWAEEVVYVTGCVVVPDQVYEFRAMLAPATFSDPLVVTTTPAPSLSGSWADTVGTFDSGTQGWGPPQGNVDFRDISALVGGFQQFGHAPVTWLDLSPQWPNYVINFGDVSAVIKGFQVTPYFESLGGFPSLADCPLGDQP